VSPILIKIDLLAFNQALHDTWDIISIDDSFFVGITFHPIGVLLSLIFLRPFMIWEFVVVGAIFVLIAHIFKFAGI
jgi:hypothetical protein